MGDGGKTALNASVAVPYDWHFVDPSFVPGVIFRSDLHRASLFRLLTTTVLASFDHRKILRRGGFHQVQVPGRIFEDVLVWNSASSYLSVSQCSVEDHLSVPSDGTSVFNVREYRSPDCGPIPAQKYITKRKY